MRGSLPKLECPECGYDAGSERSLYKTRRGWRRIVVGVVLLLLSAYPSMIVGGWCRERAVTRGLDKRNFMVVGRTRVGSDWLVDRLPKRLEHLFGRVDEIRSLSSGTDADVAECTKLWRLKKLWLNSPDVTDVGVAHLSGLPRLRHLALFDMQVTDAKLAYLAGLRKLEALVLCHAHVTDTGLARVKELPQLQ